ncbi:MAG: polyphosphate kinase 1 [Sedimentisphaeraceae bacterium JB056]
MPEYKKLNDPKLFINRELSWIEFNRRVLLQSSSKGQPLLERLKFLSIVSSNFDEFFMIRVAGLIQRRDAGIAKKDISGLTTNQQLKKIRENVCEVLERHSEILRDVVKQLRKEKLDIAEVDNLDPRQITFLEGYFVNEILPLLTPLMLKDKNLSPVIPGLGINIGLIIQRSVNEADGTQEKKRVVIVPVPKVLPSFISVPSESGLCLVPVEDVVSNYIKLLFPKEKILSKAVFRVTRDADVEIQEDEAGDLLETVEKAVISRRRREVVRLELSEGYDKQISERLANWFALKKDDIYVTDSLMDSSRLIEILKRPGFEHLKINEWPPQVPGDLADCKDIWQRIDGQDVLLFHPYESFSPVVRMIEDAANDPDVLAIKQTLYRTSGDSPIISALEKAAKSGKQVTVLVELKARFDEQNNIVWARRLEDAGCYVIYGISGFKTHSKALLIVKRKQSRICRYVHLATGNYNDKTAKIYSDVGLLTSDTDIASDTAAFFNLLTGYSDIVPLSKLTIAPTNMRQRIIGLIEREISNSTPDRKGLVMAKMNSLEDPEICRALYKASMAGVKVKLNVRGICCLRPGLKGVSTNIEVCSIVDRYLEHSRIFYFANGGHEEVYLSSADWMRRNLDSRLEILFPVKSAELRKRLVSILNTFFSDNVSSYLLRTDGSYKARYSKGEKVRAQQKFYEDAVDYLRTVKNSRTKFHPMTRPR